MPAPSIHAFAEKVVLIADGTSPVGRAVALQLALQGSYVVAGYAAASAEAAAALAELQTLGTLAAHVEADAATAAGAARLVGEVGRMFGRIDLLINNLNFQNDSTFTGTTEEIYAKTLDANLKAAFFVTREALALMETRPKPKIVNVVSALDTPETQGNVLFAAAQKSLIGLTESLAAALPKKFRVNAVAVSEKPRPAENLDAELFRRHTTIPADDAARTILFLLSAEAVGLNGQVLKVE